MTSKSMLDKHSSRSFSKRHGRHSGSKLSSIAEIEAVNPQRIAGDIVADILDAALDKIHQKYLETQTIKFVVHCAHQALLKTLRIHFYQHNDYIRTSELWSSDTRLEPSSPDSWAFHQVPLLPVAKGMTVSPSEQELNTMSLIKLDAMSQEGEFAVSDEMELVPTESLIMDVRATIDDIIDNLPIVDEEEPVKSVSEISAFGMVVEGLSHYNDYRMKPQVSRLSMGPSMSFRLPRIDVPEQGLSRNLQSLIDVTGEEMDRLPPIRTDASYKCQSMSLVDTNMKKTKGKKGDHN